MKTKTIMYLFFLLSFNGNIYSQDNSQQEDYFWFSDSLKAEPGKPRIEGAASLVALVSSHETHQQLLEQAIQILQTDSTKNSLLKRYHYHGKLYSQLELVQLFKKSLANSREQIKSYDPNFPGARLLAPYEKNLEVSVEKTTEIIDQSYSLSTFLENQGANVSDVKLELARKVDSYLDRLIELGLGDQVGRTYNQVHPKIPLRESTIVIKTPIASELDPPEEECLDVIADYLPHEIDSKIKQELLEIQTELTLNRLAWAYLKYAKKDESGVKEKFEQTILNLLKDKYSKEKSPSFQQAVEQFQKAPLSRRALAQISPFLMEILNLESGADITERPYLINESDLKMLDILSAREKDWQGKLFTDHKRDESILNLTKIIGSSYRDGLNSEKAWKENFEIVNNEILRLSGKQEELLGKLKINENMLKQCQSIHLDGTSCTPISNLSLNVENMQNSLVDLNAEILTNYGLNTANDHSYKGLRYNDIWLSTAKKGYKMPKEPRPYLFANNALPCKNSKELLSTVDANRLVAAMNQIPKKMATILGGQIDSYDQVTNKHMSREEFNRSTSQGLLNPISNRLISGGDEPVLYFTLEDTEKKSLRSHHDQGKAVRDYPEKFGWSPATVNNYDFTFSKEDMEKEILYINPKTKACDLRRVKDTPYGRHKSLSILGERNAKGQNVGDFIPFKFAHMQGKEGRIYFASLSLAEKITFFDLYSEYGATGDQAEKLK